MGMTQEHEKPKEALEKDFYKTLTEYFSVRETPTGFFNTVGGIRDHLETLNKNLEQSNKSSTKLSKALNRLTLWGVIVAIAGVGVALGHLIFEIYRYSNGG
jgi:hypothetical protein